MRNLYIVNKPVDDGAEIPVVNWYLKDYYTKHGKYRAKYNWHPPIISTPYEQVDFTATPDVVGFSCYIWNRDYLYDFAQKLKQDFPTCKIVFGGPQTEFEFFDDFWDRYPFIDYVVPSQGEHVFAEFLDRLIDGTERDTAEIVHRDFRNMPKAGLKEKVWSDQWILEYQHELLEVVQDYKRTKGEARIVYETTRGCPYGCLYCDWGGGLYSKVRAKPIDVIKREIDILSQLEIDSLYIGDANVGILERDVQVIEHVVHNKLKHGYPKSLTFAVTKSNHFDRVEKIMDICLANDMFSSAPRLALQDVNDYVLKQIDRKNIHWVKQIEMADRLTEKYGTKFGVDMIFGMPGQTVQSWLETNADLYAYGYFPQSNHMSILPNAPIAKKAFIDKFNIQYRYVHVSESGFSFRPKTAEDRRWMVDNGMNAGLDDDANNCLITKSCSFDEYDLGSMKFIDDLFTVIGSSKMFAKLEPVLRDYSISKKDFMIMYAQSLLRLIKTGGLKELGDQYRQIITAYTDMLRGERDHSYIDIQDDWRILVDTSGATRFFSYWYHEKLVDHFVSCAIYYKIPIHEIRPVAEHQKKDWLSPHRNTAPNGSEKFLIKNDSHDITWHLYPSDGVYNENYFFRTCTSVATKMTGYLPN